ncbi:MAG: toprim domain-containing protein [Candidatus Micrarchaeota archaeon]
MVRTTEEAQNTLKKLRKLLSHIKEGWVFAEGLRDRRALERLGCMNVLTISGNLKSSCEKVRGKTDEVIVLTDLDRRGDELARKAKEELEGLSIRADLETRKKLAGILRLKYFEEAARKYEELMEKMREKRID